jgi:hypothetical protein
MEQRIAERRALDRVRSLAESDRGQRLGLLCRRKR